MTANTPPVTTRSPEAAAQILLPALRARATPREGISVTTADAAATTGLALREAESGLHLLTSRYRGHLAVTQAGDLIFKFADGLRTNWQRRSRMLAFLRWIGRGLDALVKLVARVAITVLLLGYALFYVVALTIGAFALAVAAKDDGPAEVVFHLWWLIWELIADAFFYTAHFSRPASPRYADALAPRRLHQNPKKRNGHHLYESVNRFFIGVRPRRESPREIERKLIALIRSNGGVTTSSQVMSITGKNHAETEARLSRLLLDHEGTIEVSDEGAILYHFPALMTSAGSGFERRDLSPVWTRPVEVVPYTGNSTSSNIFIILLTCFNGAMGYIAMRFGLPIYIAEVPLVMVCFLLSLPILRIVPTMFARARARGENGRRAMLGAVLQGAAENRLIGHAELAKAWKSQVGREPPKERIHDLVLDLDGELDANIDAFTAPDVDSEEAPGRGSMSARGLVSGYRFDTVAAEVQALEDKRQRLLAAPAEDTAIVFASDA